MASEQPRYFTIFDAFWQIVDVTVIATGCYLGWKLGGSFIEMLAGGIIGRVLEFILVLSLRGSENANGKSNSIS